MKVKIASHLIGLYLFFSPLYCLGFGGITFYRLPASQILAAVCVVTIIPILGLDRRAVFGLALFSIYSLGFTMIRGVPGSYFLSFFTFFVSAILVCVNFREIDRRVCLIWLFSGVIITLCVGYYDVIAFQFSLPDSKTLIPTDLNITARNQDFSGILRLRGLMLEPAHLAHCLAICFVVLDASGRYLSGRLRLILKIVVFASLIATFSFGGLILFVAYWVLISNVSSGMFRRAVGLIGLLILLFGALYILNTFNPDLSNVYFRRFSSLINVLQGSEVGGSVESRVGTIFIPFAYLKQEGLFSAIVGEGYSQHEMWLIYNYFGMQGLSYEAGKVSNIFVVVFLGGGLIGLGLFLHFIYSVFSIKNYFTTRFFLFAVLCGFSSGMLVSYRLWSLFVLLVIFCGPGSSFWISLRNRKMRVKQSIR